MRIGSRVVKVPVNYGSVPDDTPRGSVIAMHRDCDDHLEEVTIRWDDGQVETAAVCSEHAEILDVTPELYVNLYLWDRAYGGPEEGGWWYNTYAPVTEQDWDEPPPQHGHFPTPEAAADAFYKLEAWCDEQNKHRRSPNSMASEGHYTARLEAWPAEHYPVNRPHYC